MDDEKLNEAVAEVAAELEADEKTLEEVPVELETFAEDVVSAVEQGDEDELVELAVANVEDEALSQATFVEETTPALEPAPEPAPAPERQKAPKATKSTSAKKASSAGLGMGAWIGIAAACLVVGLLLGRFALGGGNGGAIASNTTVSEAGTVTEDQLDAKVASFTYNGTTQDITVRELIEQTGSLDSAKTEDDTYTVPSAEYAIQVARTFILRSEAGNRGISVSDDDVTAYAEETLGTSDMASIASAYGMDEEVVKQLIADNCLITALRNEVAGTESPTMPDAPDSPEEGKEDEKTQAYADYIIELAGDEWDSKKGEWADAEGAYATALAEADFAADGATYDAATSAYYVAYQKYSEAQSAINEAWSTFENGLMANASISINTLVM